MTSSGSAPPSLAFIHVPKTGGRAFRAALTRYFAARESIVVDFGLEALSDDVFRSARFVAGHTCYEFVAERLPGFRRLVVLRDPFRRALSQFAYWRQLDPRDYAPERARRIRSATEKSLERFLAEDEEARWLLGSTQTRALLGGERSGLPSTGDLEKALENLDACEYVTTTESMQDALDVVAYELGKDRQPELPLVNETLLRVPDAELTDRAQSLLSAIVAPERDLYGLAREKGRALRERRGDPPADPALGEVNDLRFSASDAFTGGGWYEREADRERWLLWSGPERESWLFLPPVFGRVRVAFGIRYFITDGVRESLRFFVDDHEVSVARVQHDSLAMFEGALDRPRPSNPPRYMRLGWRIGDTFRPSDLSTGSRDTRRLGFALSELVVDHVSS